ncbi:MAG: ABC transporter substrate-binding protein [Acetobacteraceae bacterium]
MERDSTILRRSVIAGLGVGLGAGLAAPALIRSARAAEDLQIGALFPLSGPLSVLGTEAMAGAQIGADLVNERGGVFGQKVVLDSADATSPANATNEARRLINRNGRKLLVGAYGSAISLAIAGAANQLKVPYFEGSAVADDLTQRGYPYVFRLNDNARAMAAAQVQAVEEIFAPKLGKPLSELKIAVIHEDGAFGTSVARDFVEQVKQRSVTNVSVEPYSANAQDLSSLLLRLKSDAPDVLAATQYFNDAVLFWRQARNIGYTPRYFIAIGSGQATPDYRAGVGADGDGVLLADVPSAGVKPDALKPEARTQQAEFVKRYRAKLGKDPASHATRHFSSISVLLGTILPKAGSLDPDKIREAALSLDEPLGSTILGFGIKFGEDGQNTRAFDVVLQWQAGALVTVWPERFATAAPIMVPLPSWAERGKAG